MNRARGLCARLADLATRVLAVETAESAFHDLENNVRRDAVARERTTTRRLTVEAALADADLRTEFPWAEAAVVLDPPRTGLGKPARGALAELRPARLLYLSCDPATLARDAGLLVHQAGYRCTHAGVVNMFPHTAHVESLAVFERT